MLETVRVPRAYTGTLAHLLTALVLAMPAAAQEPRGRIEGRVRSTVGEPLPGANVILLPGVVTTTDRDGNYNFVGVAPGGYTLRLRLIGYAPQSRQIVIQPGEVRREEFTMESAAVQLDSVVVLGEDRVAQAIRRIRESPFAVTVIDGQRLAGRGLTLDEALQRATGVQIRRSGGLGSASVFNIRGLEGQRVQIYVNGNAADVAGNSFSLDDIPLQLVERIEVYKGVVPARFGGDGLGAAVNVVTIRPEGGYLDLGYTGGSYGQHQLSATANRPLGRGVEGAVSVNLDRAENDYAMDSPFLDGVRLRRDHDGFRRLLAGGVLRTSRLGFDEVELEAAYIGLRRELQGIQTNVQHAETHSRLGVLVLDGETQGGLGGRLDLRVGAALVASQSGVTDTSAVRYSFEGEPFPSPNGRGELSLLPSDSDNRTTLFRHRLAATYRLSEAHAANLTYVLDFSRYRPRDSLANQYAGRNVSEFPGDQSSAVVSLSHEWRPLGDRLVNIVGARGYFFDSKGTPSNLSDPAAERPPPIHNSTVSAGASEAIRYRLTSALLAKGSVEWARRLPTSSELFGDGLLVTATPTLRPERSLNFNLGLQYDRTLDDGRRVQAEATGFWMELRDMIRLTPGFAGLAGYANLGAARVVGAEAEVRADITRWLHGAVGLTYQNARDRLRLNPGTSVPNPTFGLRLPHMPWLFGTALVEARAEGLLGRTARSRLFAEGLFTEEYFYAFELSNRQERRIPRALTLTLGAEQTWPATGLTLSAEVQNLTDATVLNQFNYPLPGRTLRMKVRYTWVKS
jgi:vitamin B12 transporter